MSPLETLTIKEVIALINETLPKVRISRSMLYRYIQTKGFPTHIGLGWPRQWSKSAVIEWLSKQVDGVR